ncbi:MAG: CDP-alcohol phosphatidyltransferase family protein [Frankiaceae bacterium]|nr:CDP-alcohol phosphatidyltransferase family protein [Frankiaceae bacterium]
MSARPSLEELRRVSQPDSVMKRASGEHWAGSLYQRHLSIRMTRLIANSRVTPNGLTWFMLLLGIGAAAVLAIPTLWAVVVAMLMIQLQGTVDCMDGELARWRRQTGPIGIYVNRIGHYVTDGGLAVAVGVHADGGYRSIGGWTTIGLATGFLVLLSKSETDLVHVARAQAGRDRIADTTENAASHQSLVRRLRSFAATLPFNRLLLATELTLVAVIVAAVDQIRGGLTAFRVLDGTLLAIAGLVVVGHLLATVTSNRLR